MRQMGRHAADHDRSNGAAQSSAAPATPRVLVLGGSTEGFEAADALVALGYDVVTSFAGRTKTRRAPAGLARVGGFGGIDGLAAYLAVEDFSLVLDATHPFATQIKANAAAACAEAGTPLLHVDRPAWTPKSGDDWRIAPDVETAARIAPATAGPCFLTTGRQELRHFAARTDLDLLIRVIDPPQARFDHPRATFIYDRGPFDLDAERTLFRERRIGCVVAKNSGSPAAEAKLVAARERGVPVILVDRPAPPQGIIFHSAAEAVGAASAMLGGTSAC